MESTSSRSRLTAVACLVIAFGLAAGVRPRAQEREAIAAFDEVLDTRVRDGYVYYRALKADRAPLDRYVTALPSAQLPAGRDAQIAFWLNAYNALVLRTVVDRYPIAARSGGYPSHSIKQIAGAFERTPHVVAGKPVTLDQIEQSMLAAFHDPRVFLALGRGAADGGRLRGEVYTAEALERQLTEQAAECARRDRCIHVDPVKKIVQVSSIFSWRRAEFLEADGRQGDSAFAKRPPLERAVLAFINPRVIPAERDFLARNQFTVQYLPFDWSLNDLATRKK